MLEYSKQPRKKLSRNKSEHRSLHKNDDLIDLFPLPRYFQIHFAHLHETADTIQSQMHQLDQDLQVQLNQLTKSLAQVESKLDQFIALLCCRLDP
jgi:hypothetical protein